MALTQDQIRTAFMMLRIPYAGPLVQVDNIGLNTINYATYSTNTSAQTKLYNWLVTDMDPDSRTRAGEIIDSYQDMQSSLGLSLNGGSVGSITGINYNVNEAIQERVIQLQTLVPFFKQLRDMVDGTTSTGTITECRVFY